MKTKEKNRERKQKFVEFVTAMKDCRGGIW